MHGGFRAGSAHTGRVAAEEPKATDGPALSMSDEATRRMTGRGWEEWFDPLDEWARPSERAGRLCTGLPRSAGSRAGAQAVSVTCERARGLRASASTTMASRSPPRRPWRCRSIGCTRRSSTSRCVTAGCPRASSGSAPPRSRDGPASTGRRREPGRWSAAALFASRQATWSLTGEHR